MKNPKATQNKAKDVETKQQPEREKLEAELGRSIYEVNCYARQIEELKELARPFQQKAKQITAELERLDNGKKQ